MKKILHLLKVIFVFLLTQNNALCQSSDIAEFGSSTTVINRTNNLIYGLKVGLTSLDAYIVTVGGATLEIVKSLVPFCGIGTVFNDKQNVVTFNTFKVVIFGDFNDDSNIYAIDAGRIVDYENNMFKWNPATDLCYLRAVDVNGDNNYDSIDASIVLDCEYYQKTINQITVLAN